MSTDKHIFLSKKGLKELRSLVIALEHELQRKQRVLSEIDKGNAREERLNRIEQLAQIEIIESELSDKKMRLSQAKQLPNRRSVFKVVLGSVVDLIDIHGNIIRYQLVDSLEANPSDGRISIKSPLGRTLLGRQLRDVVEWTAGLQKQQLILVSIG